MEYSFEGYSSLIRLRTGAAGPVSHQHWKTLTAAQSMLTIRGSAHTHTHKISLMHCHSCLCLHWADLLCETKPDGFSLLSSIVAFKYANQYHQLAPTNQSIPHIPQGAGLQTFTLWKWQRLKESTDCVLEGTNTLGLDSSTQSLIWWGWCGKRCPLLVTAGFTLQRTGSHLEYFIYFKLVSSQRDDQNKIEPSDIS